MLPDNAFMRNMPNSLSIEDRLRCEAIVTSCDVVALAFTNLEKTLRSAFASNLQSISSRDLTAMSMSCWTIVDHLHVFLQFLRRQTREPDGVLDRFLNDFEFVTHMRNAMDHLHTNIKNAAGRKDAVDPLHGTVLFSGPLEADMTFEYVIVPLAALHRGRQVSPVIDTHAVPPTTGIGNISFAAFDNQLNLSEVVVRLSDALQSYNDSAERFCRQAIEQIAPEHGLDADQLWNAKVSGNVYFRVQLPLRSH